MIIVKRVKDNDFEVTVEGSATTTHRVQLSDDYYQKLTDQKTSREDLIKESFEFLLDLVRLWGQEDQILCVPVLSSSC